MTAAVTRDTNPHSSAPAGLGVEASEGVDHATKHQGEDATDRQLSQQLGCSITHTAPDTHTAQKSACTTAQHTATDRVDAETA